MSPAPNYQNQTAATNAANQTYANTRQKEVEAGNDYASSFADLVFPANREEEKKKAQGTSYNLSFAHGGMVGRRYAH
jgi:hypothetical protein